MDEDALVVLTYLFGVLALSIVLMIAIAITLLIGRCEASWFEVGAVAMLSIELVVAITTRKMIKRMRKR